MAKYHIVVEVKDGTVQVVHANFPASRTFVEIVDHDTQDLQTETENKRVLRRRIKKENFDQVYP